MTDIGLWEPEVRKVVRVNTRTVALIIKGEQLHEVTTEVALYLHRSDLPALRALSDACDQALYELELGDERDVFAFRSGPKRCEHMSCRDADGYWAGCKLAAQDQDNRYDDDEGYPTSDVVA